MNYFLFQLDGLAPEDPAVIQPCVTVLQKLNSQIYSGLKTEIQVNFYLFSRTMYGMVLENHISELFLIISLCGLVGMMEKYTFGMYYQLAII